VEYTVPSPSPLHTGHIPSTPSERCEVNEATEKALPERTVASIEAERFRWRLGSSAMLPLK
jgi:hypothetical protein